jgi:predicted component of type VI protein secretion system
MKSIHQKLERVRSPRVHISYEVEAGGGRTEEGVTLCRWRDE